MVPKTSQIAANIHLQQQLQSLIVTPKWRHKALQPSSILVCILETRFCGRNKKK